VHDAQYTLEELPVRRSWGHCAADYPAALAEQAGAARVLLFHHEPSRTDTAVQRLADEVRARHPGVRVDPAVEGTVIHL
jgi:ribonuclease BN (tRNA processing enzyme)